MGLFILIVISVTTTAIRRRRMKEIDDLTSSIWPLYVSSEFERLVRRGLKAV
jgi:hypothetical protein